MRLSRKALHDRSGPDPGRARRPTVRGTGATVAVIGAGPSGLTAAKHLLQAGISRVTVFEQSHRVGGNWVYTPGESHSSVFETTHIISSKSLSQFADFPMPAGYPDYPSHRQVLEYFERYADRFGLREVIRFDAEVTAARRTPGGGWDLTLDDGTSGHFDHLLVCNGHHWLPRWPDFPGEFTGTLLHSHHYKSAAPFAGSRVLVIGGGNSACDIAVETGRVAAHVGISWRRGYYVVPKLVLGLPPDVLDARTRWLPAPLRRRLFRLIWRLSTGGAAPYGLPEPDHPILSTHPVVNSELLYFIRHGRVHPYPDVRRFAGTRIEFADGRSAEFDTVVAATGFRIAFPFLEPGVAEFGDGEVPLFLRVFHPVERDLFFIGLIQPAGCIWPLAEAQARLVANWIAGRWELPSDLRSRIDADLARRRSRYLGTPRHAIEVDYHEHLAELAAALPADAPPWRDVSPVAR